MTPDELAAAWSERFGDAATTTDTFGTLTVDVGPETWVAALTFARDDLGCGFFDWLTGVDELADGFGVVAHVYSLDAGHHLLIRTKVPRDEPALPTATGVYRGANWHERETYEMFGVLFDGHPNMRSLLLPDGFEGHPLRKEFVLAARVAKPWPGAKEPGESSHGAPSRRRMLPPGVPDDWGPQAATPAPAEEERPARRERPARAARPAVPEDTDAPERPARRPQSAEPADTDDAPTAKPPARRPRRAQSAAPAESDDAGTTKPPGRRPRGVEGGGDA